MVLALLLALLASCRSAFAAADQSGDDKSAVQAATYSTGKSGSRLKWIAAAAGGGPGGLGGDAGPVYDACLPARRATAHGRGSRIERPVCRPAGAERIGSATIGRRINGKTTTRSSRPLGKELEHEIPRSNTNSQALAPRRRT